MKGDIDINLLKQYRNEKGYTQSEVAEKIGVSERQYQRYEYGLAIPPVHIARKLSGIFNTTIEAIFAE